MHVQTVQQEILEYGLLTMLLQPQLPPTVLVVISPSLLGITYNAAGSWGYMCLFFTQNVGFKVAPL